MTRILLTAAVDSVDADPLGVKEAAVMALEHLGGVQILHVDIEGPEQMELAGVVPAQVALPAGDKPYTAQAMAAGSSKKRKRPGPHMDCCLSCAHYQQRAGRDEMGALYWGICRRTDRPVYKLRERCGSWKGR